MKCDTKTMLKICAVALALLGLGILLFPQLRSSLILLVPFALLAICLAMCPLMMFFGMGGMKHDRVDKVPEKDTTP